MDENLNAFFIADVYRTLLAVIVLLYASYMDVKTREIPPKLWLVGSLLAAPATAYETWVFVIHGFADYVLLAFLGSAIVIGILGIMMLKGLIGGADVLALAFLTIDMPWYPFSFGGRALVPIPLLTLFYATAAAAIWLPIRGLFNLRREDFREHAKEVGVRGLRMLRLAMASKVVTIDEYLKMKFWYPLELFEEKNGKIVSRVRSTFSVEEEYKDHQENIRKLVEKGLIEKNKRIFVTYGVPFLVYITVGFLLALALGDIPLRILFGR